MPQRVVGYALGLKWGLSYESSLLKADWWLCCLQNAKLSVFATRPGIRSPVFNWIVASSSPASPACVNAAWGTRADCCVQQACGPATFAVPGVEQACLACKDAPGCVQEFAGTAVMMFSMQLLEKRGAGLSPDNLVLWNTLKALYSAFIIAVLILGLGGPTGMISACQPDTARRMLVQPRVDV